MRGLLPILLIASSFTLALGIVLPLVRFQSFYFFSDTPSLAGILGQLWSSGDTVLFSLVGLFSVMFPLAKLLAIALMADASSRGSKVSRLTGRIVPVLSKWSMMDVMLVAILIVAAKTSGIASALTQPGLWCYTASALMAAAAQSLADHAGRPLSGPPG